MLVELANDMEFHMGKDKYGKDWHVNILNGLESHTLQLHLNG